MMVDVRIGRVVADLLGATIAGLIVWMLSSNNANAQAVTTAGHQYIVGTTGFTQGMIPSAVLDGVVSTANVARIDRPYGQDTVMYATTGMGSFMFPSIMFGEHGLFQLPDNVLGWYLYIEAIGAPEINFRHLWGPGGSNTSFASIAFTRVLNAVWEGVVLTPQSAGDPYGFEVSTLCAGFPCSSRVYIGYGVASPVPEPSTWATMLVGLALVISSLRVRARAGRRRTFS